METNTPETDALELQLYQTQPDAGTVERMRLSLCRKLERERDAYAQSLRDIANAEGPIITENVFVRHPELAPKD